MVSAFVMWLAVFYIYVVFFHYDMCDWVRYMVETWSLGDCV